MSKIIVAFYLVIFSFSYLTGGTAAYFSNSNQGIMKFKAGTWYDGSILKFVGNNGTVVDQSCPSVEISADFKNVGHKMRGPAKYEVYYTETESKGKGSPENHGSPIFEGQIQPLDKNEVVTLSFVADNEGFYVFKVYQVENFEGKEKDKEIWSNKFNIKCKDKGKNKQNTEEQEMENGTSEEAVEDVSQSKEQTNKENEVVEEPSSETVEEETSQPDSAKNENNQNNEQNDSTTEDVSGEEVNSSEGSNNGEVEAADTNNQPAGEGETNEETN